MCEVIDEGPSPLFDLGQRVNTPMGAGTLERIRAKYDLLVALDDGKRVWFQRWEVTV